LLPSGGYHQREEKEAPVDPNHEILFEPVQVGPKTLRNRFYQVPHCSGFGTDKPWTQAAHRGVKAEGGWAAVCTEYAPFSPDSDEAPLIAARFWDEDDMRALRLMTDAAHEHGALAGLELYHGGAHIANNQTRLPSVAPSQLASDLEPHVVPKEMELKDIARVQRQWAEGATRPGIADSTSCTCTGRTRTCRCSSSHPSTTNDRTGTAER
jgi:dimethylamine/trimethylamine dehydrogenase